MMMPYYTLLSLFIADSVYGTAAEMQAIMMTLWSLELGDNVVASSWNGFYSNTGHPCKNNTTCANEACLLSWFTGYINDIKPNYTAYFVACNPQFCDVVFHKSLVTKVVSFLSTLGGLWGPLYMGALLLWLLLARLPCLAAPEKQLQQQQRVKVQVCK
jgi:hypothetical protein